MAKFEVSWVEYHSVIIDAEDKEIAYDKAFEEDNGNTCKNVGQEEVKPIKI